MADIHKTITDLVKKLLKGKTSLSVSGNVILSGSTETAITNAAKQIKAQQRERVEKMKHELIISRDVLKAIDTASHGAFPQISEVVLNRVVTIDTILAELEDE